MAKHKQITLTFQASTEMDFDRQIEKIKAFFVAHDLMRLEYGDIKVEGISIKLDRLMSGMM